MTAFFPFLLDSYLFTCNIQPLNKEAMGCNRVLNLYYGWHNLTVAAPAASYRASSAGEALPSSTGSAASPSRPVLPWGSSCFGTGGCMGRGTACGCPSHRDWATEVPLPAWEDRPFGCSCLRFREVERFHGNTWPRSSFPLRYPRALFWSSRSLSPRLCEDFLQKHLIVKEVDL